MPPGPARPPSREAALRGGGSSGRRGAALARVDTRRRSGRSSLRLRRSPCAPCARRARHNLPSRPCDTTSSKRARCFLGMKILPARTAESGRAPRPRPDRAKPLPKVSFSGVGAALDSPAPTRGLQGNHQPAPQSPSRCWDLRPNRPGPHQDLAPSSPPRQSHNGTDSITVALGDLGVP